MYFFEITVSEADVLSQLLQDLVQGLPVRKIRDLSVVGGNDVEHRLLETRPQPGVVDERQTEPRVHQHSVLRRNPVERRLETEVKRGHRLVLELTCLREAERSLVGAVWQWRRPTFSGAGGILLCQPALLLLEEFAEHSGWHGQNHVVEWVRWRSP